MTTQASLETPTKTISVSSRDELETRSEIEKSEERYRLFIQRSSKGVWRAEIEPPIPTDTPIASQIAAIRENSKIAEGNQSLARQLRYSSVDELIGRDVRRLFKTFQSDDDRLLLEFVKAGYHISDLESSVESAEGTFNRYLNSLVGIVEDGFLVRIWGTHRDISQHRRSEASLRESEHQFRMLADNSPVLIWMTGKDLEELYYSRGWEEFTGKKLEPLRAGNWSVDVHPEDRIVVQQRRDLLGLQRPFRIQYRLRYRDGCYRHMLDTATPRFAADGEFEGYIGSCVDVTEIKQAEAIRARILEIESSARSEAERLNRMKDEFFATVSHELRTPLNAILGWTQLLRSKRLSDAESERALEIIERNGQLQSQIINDLLDMTAISSGQVKLTLSPNLMSEIIGQAFQTLRPAAEAKNIEFHLEAGTMEKIIEVDRDRLHQVFWNLLSNAIKFTPEGGRVRAIIACDATDTTVTLTDSGIGIEPEFLPFVFDRFRQWDASSTRRHGGLGLGLSIVKQLVQLHGGDIKAQSEGTGLGAAFVLRLPLASSRSAATPTSTDPASSQSPDYRSASSELATFRILIVDDHDDSLHLLQNLLMKWGATVHTAHSAAEALLILKQEQVDTLISDLAMPEVDGFELMRCIRRLPPRLGGEVGAIALTSFTRDTDREQAFAAGYQEFVSKPIDHIELYKAITRTIENPKAFSPASNG